MPPCLQCSSSLHDSAASAPPRFLRTGDVGRISESVNTPIELILTQYTGLDPDSTLFRASHTSLSYLSSKASRNNKTRPCLILEAEIRADTMFVHPLICLMATFGRTHITALPYVFRYFVFPVFPHYAIDNSQSIHMHSSPADWPKSDAWFIAASFRSVHHVRNRWKKKGHPDYRYFGSEAVEMITQECQSRRRSWQVLCASDKTKAYEYAKEYRTHIQSRRASSHKSWSSGSSIGSTYDSSTFSTSNSVWTTSDWKAAQETQSIHEVFDAASVKEQQLGEVIAEPNASPFLSHLTRQMHNDKVFPSPFEASRTSLSRPARSRHMFSPSGAMSSVLSAASGRPGEGRSKPRSPDSNRGSVDRFSVTRKNSLGGH